MEKLKEILKRLEEEYKNQKIEMTLMLLFVIAGICLGAAEVSQEAASSNISIKIDMKEDEEMENGEGETTSEESTETGSEDSSELEEKSATIKDGEGTETETGENAISKNQETIYLQFYTLETAWRLPEDTLPQLVKEDSETKEMRLEAALKEKLAAYDGDWSVYVKNLKNDETILINDRPMKSASVMKLFILGTMYQSFEEGELERTDELMALMKDMIIYSSNDASNELLYRLGDSDYAAGIAKVNAFIQDHDFSDMTIEYNGFNDPATNTGSGHYNQVAAKDCGRLLEAIYHREWVSRSVSNEIEQMMLNQNTRYKIPRGLPEGVLCGNKSGEMDTTENDAAIIYGDSCDYILVVLSSDWNSKDEAISRIQSISALVYEYLEGTEAE